MRRVGGYARRLSALLLPPVYTQYALPDLSTRARDPFLRTASARFFASVLLPWHEDFVNELPKITIFVFVARLLGLRFLLALAPVLRRRVAVVFFRAIAILCVFV